MICMISHGTQSLMTRTDLFNDFMTGQPTHHPAIDNNNNIKTIIISCNNYHKKKIWKNITIGHQYPCFQLK